MIFKFCEKVPFQKNCFLQEQKQKVSRNQANKLEVSHNASNLHLVAETHL